MSSNLEDKPLLPVADRDAVLGYLVLRICLGVNIALHGIARLPVGSGVFVQAITKQFAQTPLPTWSVQAFGNSLPWIESVIGLMLLCGIASRYVLLVAVSWLPCLPSKPLRPSSFAPWHFRYFWFGAVTI